MAVFQARAATRPKAEEERESICLAISSCVFRIFTVILTQSLTRLHFDFEYVYS